jgi:hypothetical protein
MTRHTDETFKTADQGELTIEQLDQVAGGDAALTHETVHSGSTNTSNQLEYLTISLKTAWISSVQ